MGKDLKGKELGMGLCQKKDGRYSARFTRRDGSRKEKNFTKVTDAREWLSEQKYLDNTIGTGDMTVDDWYRHWITDFKKDVVAENTLKSYSTRYKVNVKDSIGKMKLCDVKQIHCQRILNEMYECAEYAQGTMEQTQITMHAIFKGAIENGYLYRNPAEGLKIKKRDNEVERRVLTREEQREFVEYARDTLYGNAYRLVLQTGLRAGEIGGLKWSDIDFERKTIFVQRTLLQQKSKGGFYFGAPKSRDSKRIIPLTDEALFILNSQKIKQKKLRAKSKQWDNTWDGLVFTTVNGKPVGSSTFRSMMIRVINNINFDRKLNANEKDYNEFKHAYMHSLRHTFATRCVENGMNPKALQKILGHSTLAVTMDIYVHLTDDQRHIEMEKMNVAI